MCRFTGSAIVVRRPLEQIRVKSIPLFFGILSAWVFEPNTFRLLALTARLPAAQVGTVNLYGYE